MQFSLEAQKSLATKEEETFGVPKGNNQKHNGPWHDTVPVLSQPHPRVPQPGGAPGSYEPLEGTGAAGSFTELLQLVQVPLRTRSFQAVQIQPDSCLFQEAWLLQPSPQKEIHFPAGLSPLAPAVLLIPWQQQGADGIRQDGKALLQNSRSIFKPISTGTHTAQILLTFPVLSSPRCRHLGCTKAVGFNTNPIAQMGNNIYHRALWLGVFW